MHLCYLTVAVLIAFHQISNVTARHDKTNVINLEIDIPKIVGNLFKTKGIKISPNNLEGGKMRSDAEDYILRIKMPNLANIAKMFFAARRYTI